MDKKYLKSVAFYAFSALIALMLVAYILYHMFGGFQVETETQVSEITTAQEVLSLDAYVFRTEKIVYSKNSGSCSYLYDDGDKVALGAEIADVYTVYSDELRDSIIELDRKITLLENSSFGENVLLSDTTVIDRQINALYYAIVDNTQSGDVSYAARKRDELLVLLNKRRLITGSVSGYSDLIAEYEAEKAELTSRLSTVSETVLAENSGYFYSSVDGYEDIFSASKIKTLTIPGFKELLESEPDSYSSAETGYPIGKLATDYVWYIVCPVDANALRYFSSGEKNSVIFPYNSDVTIDMTLERIVTQSDSDEALLIFKSTKMPDGFRYLRVQTVNIIQKTYTGYRVPVSAVRIVDGRQGVYILSGNVVLFRVIEPLYEADGYFIVAEANTSNENYSQMLKINDLIIVKGKNLYDGRIVD